MILKLRLCLFSLYRDSGPGIRRRLNQNDECQFSIIHVVQSICCIILHMAEWMHARGIVDVHIRINERFCANQNLATISRVVLISNDEQLCALSFLVLMAEWMHTKRITAVWIRINKRYYTKYGQFTKVINDMYTEWLECTHNQLLSPSQFTFFC